MASCYVFSRLILTGDAHLYTRIIYMKVFIVMGILMWISLIFLILDDRKQVEVTETNSGLCCGTVTSNCIKKGL